MKNSVIISLLTLVLSFGACKGQTEQKDVVILTPQEFHNATANKNLQLLDVRTPEEFQEGHLDDAQNVDVLKDDFAQKVESLDPEKPVYVYCRSGNRSKKATEILKGLGFKEIYDMQGGYLKWESDGLENKN